MECNCTVTRGVQIMGGRGKRGRGEEVASWLLGINAPDSNTVPALHNQVVA